MSLPADLLNSTLAILLERAEGLTEVRSPDGDDYDILIGPDGETEIGRSRIWTGTGVLKKVVYYGSWVKQIDLDTHMVFAFTDENSPVPHFTLDSVHNKYNAFHLDLIPRADLATHLQYMDHVYTPLTELFVEGKNLEGLAEANLVPRQRSIMSQWMLAYRADDPAFLAMTKFVHAYLDHWFNLIEKPWPQEVLDDIADTDLAVRDHRNRSLIFNREVDPVWDQIEPIVGKDRAENQRLNLLYNQLVTGTSL